MVCHEYGNPKCVGDHRARIAGNNDFYVNQSPVAGLRGSLNLLPVTAAVGDDATIINLVIISS